MDNVSRALLVAGGGAVSTDPLRNYVTLLLKSEGPANSNNNTFVDSSANNFTITRSGNTTQGTFSPFGDRWSNYFDGSGDYLTLPAGTTALQPGSGDFTIEFWYHYAISPAGYVNLFSYGASGNVLRLFLYTTNSLIVWTGASPIITANNAHVPNAWNHVAIVRNGLTVTLYVNGTNVGTATGASTTNYVGDLSIAFESGQTSLTGYLSNFRIVKGTAVYTANFTPPTAPLTAITNTALLTCQSNRIIDNSANNFTITKSGDVSAQRFSPFAPTAAYSAAAIGGSGYFDGGGDYLTAGTTSSFNFLHNTTALFTIEGWIFCPSFASDAVIFGTNSGTSSQVGGTVWINSSAQLRLLIGRGAAGSPVIDATSTGTVPTNQWTHIAVTYDQSLGSSNCTFYINGAVAGTASKTANAPSSSVSANPGTISAFGTTSTGACYLSNVRVNNSIVYTTAFTPPTAPVTAIANTQLLLNFTNAGVFDDAMMNNLETVGGTQISTTGGGSMSIPGGGANLYIPPSPIFDMGTGDFTIECWVNSTSIAANYPSFISSVTGWSTGSSGHRFNNLGAANKFTFHLNPAGDAFLTSTNTYSFGVWYHYALTRSGNTWRMFIDGVQQASGTYTGSFNAGLGGFRLGYAQWDGGNGFYNGFIDDVRITRGVARYVSNFTRPSDLPSI